MSESETRQKTQDKAANKKEMVAQSAAAALKDKGYDVHLVSDRPRNQLDVRMDEQSGYTYEILTDNEDANLIRYGKKFGVNIRYVGHMMRSDVRDGKRSFIYKF